MGDGRHVTQQLCSLTSAGHGGALRWQGTAECRLRTCTPDCSQMRADGREGESGNRGTEVSKSVSHVDTGKTRLEVKVLVDDTCKTRPETRDLPAVVAHAAALTFGLGEGR